MPVTQQFDSAMQGKRVTVMGLGRHGGGVAVTRWLAEQGCRVTVTDLEPADRLADSLDQLKDVPIERMALGGHDETDFRRAHLVVVNPAVRPNHPLLKLVRKRRGKLTSEIELFLERCPATVVGVTGTTGKSTTCAMLAEMLRHAGRCTWLGGNIGNSLLGDLQWMHKADVAVLELSSFQLTHLSRYAHLPQMAVVTNCSPNHLDWHESWTAYVWAKQRLLAAASPPQITVLNDEDAEVIRWQELVSGELVPLVDPSSLTSLKVPGAHNRQNARLAATAAARLGVEPLAIRAALESFTGLAHRLEFVGEVAGRKFFNDSKATSPAATSAALAAIDGAVWLLAGGIDKVSDWSTFAAQIVARTRGVALFGTARQSLFKAVRRAKPRFRAVATELLSDAMAWVFEVSRPGDTILLSPACPSFDQFADFAERGQLFAELVHALESTQSAGSKKDA